MSKRLPMVAVIGFSNTAYRTVCRLAQEPVAVTFILAEEDAFQVTDIPAEVFVQVVPYLRPKDLPAMVTDYAAAIVATEDEQFNLHATLLLHSSFPAMRIVARFFNLALGREIESRLQPVTVLSVSDRAAPFFAAAAFVDELTHAWRDQGELKATVNRNGASETLTLLAERQFSPVPATVSPRAKNLVKPKPDRLLLLVLTGLLLVILSGTLFFSWQHGFPVGDALYFVVTTLTTTGYGDYSLKEFPFSAKLAGMLVMLSGASLFAILFALLTDKLFRMRLESLLGRRPVRKAGHMIVCGAGDVGSRVLECLLLTDAETVVVERNPDGRFNQRIRDLGIPLLIADATLEETLERAGVMSARTIICATDQDMINLEIALNARALNPAIRIVLRIYDHDFAKYMRNHFGFDIALSSSAIAATAFAEAALEKG